MKNQGFFFNAESVRNVDSLKHLFHRFPLVIQTSSSMPLENKIVCRQGRVQGNYLSLEINLCACDYLTRHQYTNILSFSLALWITELAFEWF